MGLTWATQSAAQSMGVQARRRNNDAECSAVRRFLGAPCPKTPHELVCGQVPKYLALRADVFDFKAEKRKMLISVPATP
jgi:hypothetical protein